MREKLKLSLKESLQFRRKIDIRIMLKSKQFCHMISYLSMVTAFDKGNSMAEMTKEFAMIRNFTFYFIKSA